MPEVAAAERFVRLYSPLDGKVTAVFVKVGDVVTKGQVIFQVRHIDITAPCGGKVAKVYVRENIDWVTKSSEVFPLAEIVTKARTRKK